MYGFRLSYDPMSVSEKDTLRFEAKRHRERINLSEENTEQAAAYFFDKINPQAGQVVSAYWPISREIDTTGILERLIEEGITCVLPIVQPDSRVLKFAVWNDSEALIESKMGVYEPPQNENTVYKDPDILIVPLLAFDRQGYRMGYGGGYYDATIADLAARKKITTVGLAYAQQAVIFNLPREEHDQKLDWVITPQGTHCYKDE